MKFLFAWTALLACAGCSPSFDWRQMRPEGAGVEVSFPCRPDRHARPVVVAGAPTKMEMLVCSQGGATFALSFVDFTDPARVATALSELRAVALANISGVEHRHEAVQIRGMTANALAARLSMSGRLPNGAAVQEQAAFFVKGLRVYQASVIGGQLAPDMTEPFFAGLKFPP